MARVRVALTVLGVLALGVSPLLWLLTSGLGPAEGVVAALTGFAAGHDAVGWVFVPQLVLAIAVLGAALQRTACRAAGLDTTPPGWIDPAIESALLLGMLGTIHGMVNAFVGLNPEDLQPAPLVTSLGTALRSSFVGFGIALVGVWVRVGAPSPPEAPA